MKQALMALVVFLGLISPAPAAAQELLGSKGQGVISAERLMGFSANKISGERGGVDYEDDWTSLGFGWRTSADSSPFDVPRVAFDYLIINHLSLGGAIGYVSRDGDGDDISSFIVAPRVGYAYAFGRVVGIWPRGGFTYHSMRSNDTLDEKGFALTLECPFTFSPSSHFAISIGPSFDMDMFGERDPSPINKGDRLYRSFGLSAGLLGWF